MSRSFDKVSDRLTASSVPVTTYPFTVAGWFMIDATTGVQTLFSLGSDGADNHRFTLRYSSGAIGVNVRTTANDTLTNPNVNVVANVVFHFTLVMASSTNRSLYVNGLPESDTSAADPTLTSPVLYLGAAQGVSPTQFFGGLLEHFALWNVAMTDSDAKSLYFNRLSPLAVVPDRLKAYWPMTDGSDPENNLVPGPTLTLSGTSPGAGLAELDFNSRFGRLGRFGRTR